ncbi:MAG: hypothetical protein IJH04_04260 [Eggerthellaceae bacterium]|nr:hypothetical protein [Eggerthellaceae bacterium]
MPENDNSREGARSRIFKTSDVHRRRAVGQVRASSDEENVKGETRSGEEPARDDGASKSQPSEEMTVDRQGGSSESPHDEVKDLAGGTSSKRPSVKQRSGLTGKLPFMREDPSGVKVIRGSKANVLAADAADGQLSAKGDAADSDRDALRNGSEAGSAGETSADAESLAQGRSAIDGLPDAPDAGEGSPDSPADEAAFVGKRKSIRDGGRVAANWKRGARIVGFVVLALVIVFAILGASFAYDRWMRYDDAADFQGQWYVEGTDAPVTIDATVIQMNEEVAYRYTLNTSDKTISFTFGPMEGKGRYWFSADRSRLVLVDGNNFTGALTFFTDFGRAFNEFLYAVQGLKPPVPEGDNLVVLNRNPSGNASNAPESAPKDTSASSSSEKSAEDDGSSADNQEEESNPEEGSREEPADEEATSGDGEEAEEARADEPTEHAGADAGNPSDASAPELAPAQPSQADAPSGRVESMQVTDLAAPEYAAHE